MKENPILPFLDPDHAALRTHARAWAAKNAISHEKNTMAVDDAARSLIRELGNEGLLNYVIPKQFGGTRSRVQARDLCVVREELAAAEELADTVFAVQALGSYPVTIAGTEAQKASFLPAIARGKIIAAFALTEPEAGSDVSSLETRAVRHGNQYCLSGIKRFISNAGIADIYVVFASSAPEKKLNDVSAFVVPAKTAGLEVIEKTELISPHPIGVVAFDDCLVSEEALLGKEGDGLKIAFSTLDLLRCTVGAAAVGLGQRALEEALRYSSARRQFGKPIAEFQGTQFKLAEMATELEAARLLVYQAAWAHDSGAEGTKQKSSMAKFFATEAAQRIVDQALQIHGGVGLVRGSIMERLYRDVRALRIYEGTSEIQKLIIARELMKKPSTED